jgi:hypothetical protein
MHSAVSRPKQAFARSPDGVRPGSPVAVDMPRRAHYDPARWSDPPGDLVARAHVRNIPERTVQHPENRVVYGQKVPVAHPGVPPGPSPTTLLDTLHHFI